jgi:hypothetical protein
MRHAAVAVQAGKGCYTQRGAAASSNPRGVRGSSMLCIFAMIMPPLGAAWKLEQDLAQNLIDIDPQSLFF